MSKHVPFDFAPSFRQGLDYEAFLDKYGEGSDQTRWKTVFDSFVPSKEQTGLLGSFVRPMNVLCMAGTWCGDCVAQCPILAKFAAANPLISLRFVDRDADSDLANELKICGGSRVPQLVIMSEDFRPVARYGERTLSKYRQMASSVMGFEAKPASTLNVAQEWLDQLERAQWILRLSPSLREKHGD